MATTAKITEPGRAQQILDEINKLDGGKTLTQAQKDAIGTGGGGAPQNAIVSDTTQAGGGKAYANSVLVTQAVYDAIATKDPNTTYLFVSQATYDAAGA